MTNTPHSSKAEDCLSRPLHSLLTNPFKSTHVFFSSFDSSRHSGGCRVALRPRASHGLQTVAWRSSRPHGLFGVTTSRTRGQWAHSLIWITPLMWMPRLKPTTTLTSPSCLISPRSFAKTSYIILSPFQLPTSLYHSWILWYFILCYRYDWEFSK